MIIKKNKLQKYLDSLIHYGHKTNELNPKMSSYMLSEENGYHIFDLRKIEESLLLSIAVLTCFRAFRANNPLSHG